MAEESGGRCDENYAGLLKNSNQSKEFIY